MSRPDEPAAEEIATEAEALERQLRDVVRQLGEFAILLTQIGSDVHEG